jgi:hypothetical protein
MNKNMRVAALVVPSLILLGGTTIAMTNSDTKPGPNTKSITVKSTPAETSPQTLSVTEQKTATPAPNGFPRADPVDGPTLPPQAAQPDYGPKADNPSIYVILNRGNILNAAGIPKDEQEAAIATITQVNIEWHYQNDNDQRYNLCGVVPAEKMASAGDDYLTNPITQLKWCNSYVQARYGSWAAALEHASSVHSI